MVAPENGESAALPAFEAEQEFETFHGILTPVDLVAQEELVGFRQLAPNVEELDQVVELAVYVSADHHRHVHGLHVLFLIQDFLRLFAQFVNF